MVPTYEKLAKTGTKLSTLVIPEIYIKFTSHRIALMKIFSIFFLIFLQYIFYLYKVPLKDSMAMKPDTWILIPPLILESYGYCNHSICLGDFRNVT